MKIQLMPIHASQVIRPNVRMLDSPNTMIAAVPTNTAVQIAWLDTAFKAIDILSMPEALAKTRSV